MKINSIFNGFTIKSILITSMTFGISSLVVCHGQSILGKWREVSARQFLTAEGAKQTGKSVIEKQTSADDKVEWEFKPDHTYSMTSGHIKYKTVTGTWSVTKDQLAILGDAAKRAGMEPMTYTFSIEGNTMVKSMTIKPPTNTMVFKTEDTNIRM